MTTEETLYDYTGGDMDYEFQKPDNNIQLNAGTDEMIRVGPDGFWVRGVKVPQDDKEAEVVYNAFKEFLVYNAMTRKYP